jgi:GT2 family glycosyltransferase
VVVVHDGARLLPGLIRAVREQSYPVDRTVGVDTGSRDRSGAALTELLGPDAVFGMEMGTGYGKAVASALRHQDARRPGQASGSTGAGAGPGPAGRTAADAQTEWVWLLHDDCEPAPDALEHLVAAASRGRSVAVVGPKLMDFADRRVVREAGVTTDRAGRRHTGVEPGEIDQGQHDGGRAVPAVSSAGMLVRRDVWEQLGGFDPNLPLFRDDIDFCWRAHAAGYEVRVATDAVVYHRELSARQVRQAPAAGGNPRLLDRRGALYVFAVNLPLWPLLTVLGGCLAGSVARTGYFLLTKQNRKAAAYLGAMLWLFRHPRLIARERRRRAPDRKEGYAVLRSQLPRGRTLGRLAESASGVLSRGSGYESSGLHHAAADDPDDDIPLPSTDSVIRRLLTSPGVLLFAGLTVIALVAERSLTGTVFSGSGPLSGGALIPAWGGASDLWHEYLAGYHTTGVGSAASTPPYLGVMAALSTVLAGKPWLAVDLVLLGCVPVAGITAFAATRRFTAVLAVRIWIAASYALLPVAMGAVAAGRIGTAVAIVVLPLIGIALGRMFRGTPRAARRAAWAAGLLSAIAAAFVPLIWLVAVLAALAAAAAWRWLGPRTVINAAIVAVLPGILLIPWTFRLLTSPSGFFAEAGLIRPGLSVAGLRPASLLLLSPGGPGLPPVWVTAGLVLPAFGALLIRRRTTLVYAGWGIALAGLISALVASRIHVTPPQGGIAVSSWPGTALAIAAAGLLLAATPLLEAAARILGRRPDGTPHSWTDLRVLGTAAGLVVVVSAPLLAAGTWLVSGVGATVTAAGPQVLPAFVAAAATGPDRPRTLVLRQDGATLTYSVLRAADPVLGEPELAQDTASAQALASTVASLNAAGSGDAGNTGQALGQFDIGYILMPAPVDQTLAAQLNAAAGLQPLTQSPAYSLWRVSSPVARVSVETAGGSVVPVPSDPVGASSMIAPGTSGTLVLDEAAGGWSATLNGHPLTALADPVNGWAQGFTLPAGGGHLVITRDETAREISLIAEAAALLLVFALALPGTRSATVPEPAEIAPDEATPAVSRRDRVDGTHSAHRRRRLAPALAGAGTGSSDEAPEDGGHLAAAGSAVTSDHSARTGVLSSPAQDFFEPSGHPAAASPEPGYATAAGSRALSAFPPGADPSIPFPYDRSAPAGSDDGTRPSYGYSGPPGRGYGARPADDTSFPPGPGYGAPSAGDTAFLAGPDHGAPPGDDAGIPRGADPSDPRRPDPGPAAARPRRGGAHAARHGKPSRRWRGGQSGRHDDVLTQDGNE